MRLVLALALSLLAIQASAGLPELSKKQEQKLLSQITGALETAGFGNGGYELTETHIPFGLSAAEKSIEEERPDVYESGPDGEDDLTHPRHTFRTQLGIEAARQGFAEINSALGEDDPSFALIENLFSKGLVREILYRSTDEILAETYLIPHVFDVYLEYRVGSETKGYLLRLHFELGD